MKIALSIVGGLIVLVLLVFVVAYAVGASLPVNHTATVTGVVEATPERTFAIITDVAAAPSWRHEVQKVDVLPPEDGHDHWIEDLGHGTTMNFHATSTTPVDASGHGRREVLLKDPQYGGAWVYELSPGPTPAETTLKITETGYIHPPIYRFIMVHVFGMTRNLDIYLKELQARAAKG